MWGQQWFLSKTWKSPFCDFRPQWNFLESSKVPKSILRGWFDPRPDKNFLVLKLISIRILKNGEKSAFFTEEFENFGKKIYFAEIGPNGLKKFLGASYGSLRNLHRAIELKLFFRKIWAISIFQKKIKFSFLGFSSRKKNFFFLNANGGLSPP